MRSFGSLVLAVLLGTVVLPVAQAEESVPQAFQRAGINSLVSIATDGTQGESPSADADISPDGRYVTFFSDGTSLVPNDSNGWGDVYLRDTLAGTTERISEAPDGTQANQMSMQAGVSADGRYVTFLSYATSLFGDDTLPWSNTAEVFVRDRVENTITRITNGIDGGSSDRGALGTEISDDGRYVAFHSASTNLVADDTNNVADIFVFDRVEQEMSRITNGDSGSFHPEFSAGGDYIVFYSRATNLVDGDDNNAGDVFIYDTNTGTIEMVSVSSTEEIGNADSFGFPEVSADGRFVAFQSAAFNLVPNDTNGSIPSAGGDIFVRDRELGLTERVSVRASGAEFIDSTSVSLTPDGRFVAFSAIKDDSDPSDFLAPADIWLHDRATGNTELVSATPSGVPSDGESENPRLTADARKVFFQTSGGEFVPADANETVDVVVRDRVTELGTFNKKIKGFGANRSLTGSVVFPGIELAGADDAIDATGAAALGAEITGARIIYRRDQADLLLRIPVAEMPSFTANEATLTGVEVGHGGAPALIHGVRFTVGSTDFEIRAMRAAATAVPPSIPSFTRHICNTTCDTGGLTLEGGYGTAGNEIRVSITTATLALQPGETLENVTVFAGMGELATGVVGSDVDTVTLPNITLPSSRVELGIGEPESNAEGIVFEHDAGGFGGAFGKLLEGLTWEGRALWTRACLGDLCGAATKL